MSDSKGALRIGTSGYQYDHWKGTFYPEDLPKKDWFHHYADRFDTVEINNTFYNLPSKDTFDKWRETAPEGFLYSVKFSRYGSHIKKLKDPDEPIQRFIELAQRLGDTLGPILVQLPGNWHANPERLATFLETAPSNYRWALEFRDESWLCDDIYSILEEHQAALCINDMLDDHPERMTTDWTYLRFHGDHYQGSYSEDYLRAQADKIGQWLDEGRDVYAYFNNDEDGHAAHNALELRGMLNDD